MSSTRLAVWPPLPIGAYARAPGEAAPFPLTDPGCSLFSRGRHALWQGVQALGLLPGDALLVPAYHHGSEVEALLRAGLRPLFYSVGPMLEPDEAELESLLDPAVRGLYLIHYLGFPQRAAHWRRWCDERGLLLIEDGAQAWLAACDGRPVGSFGQLSFFCLYKSFGLPDGAAMHVAAPAPGPESPRRLGIPRVVRRHASWLLARSPLLAALPHPPSLGSEAAYVPARDFELGDPGSPPAGASTFLLPRLDGPGAAERRRGNYRFLLDALGERVPEPFARLPEGASPFGLPLTAARKEGELDRLERHGISALDFWSAPHPALPVARFPDAARRRRETVLLPVHQELRPQDLERIVEVVRGRPRRRPPVRIEQVESFAAIRPAWDELARETGNVFATPEWADTWWRHFGRGRPLHLLSCRAEDGRLIAILPLYVAATRPLRVVRFVGHGPADQLGIICAAADRPAAARALRRALEALRPDLFLAENLRRDEGWGSLLGGHVLRTEGNPALSLDASSWEELLASFSPNLRQQLRRLERKLTRERGLAYRPAGPPEELHRDLEQLFQLHAARWSAGSAFSAQRSFHTNFAALANERGWLRLWFLEADGRTVAAWQGFRFAGVESYYQAGRDPDWQGPSVGMILLAHSIRAALEDGVEEYRFLRGGEPYKYRFANRDAGLETLAVPRGTRGGTALAASAALPERLAVPARRRLAG